MAQYAVFMYTEKMAENCAPEYKDHSADMSASGAMIAAFELRTPEHGKAIKGDVVTDGPFADTKEVICGFYVIDSPDIDAAVEIVRQNPILKDGGRLEVRTVADSAIRSSR